MTTLSEAAMRGYLRRSISSLNQNKINGLLAEVDLRNHLASLGFADRISVGGWIARTEGPGAFGARTLAFFPETVLPAAAYQAGRQLAEPPRGLHTICATFHQLGIHSYFLAPEVLVADDPMTLAWKATQLGVPTSPGWLPFPTGIATGFRSRTTAYAWLRHNTDVTSIPSMAVAEEFSKEHARISFVSASKAEISDIDGLFWGNRFTYPLEIKEKTAANDPKIGEYFGLDAGPFVKLAFYAANRGNLHSIFVVKEIDSVATRNLVGWHFITFETLAQFASWTPRRGGTNMGGGPSSTILIPKNRFKPLDAANLSML